MFDGEGVIVRQFFHVALVAPVMTELVTGFGNANLRYGKGVAFSSQAESGDPGNIGLKGENHEVVNGTEIIPSLGLVHFTIGTLTVGVGNFGKRSVKPVVRPTGTNFGFTNGGEVLIHSAFVRCSHFFLHSTNFIEVIIQHAGLAAEPFSLGIDSILGFFEKGSENLATLAHGGKLNTVGSPGKRTLSECNFHGWVAGILPGNLCYLLIHGDGVAVSGTNFASS